MSKELKTLEDDLDDEVQEQEIVVIEEQEQQEDDPVKSSNDQDDDGETPEQRERRERTERNRQERLERKEKKKQIFNKALTEKAAIKKLYDEMIDRNSELEKRLIEQERRSQSHEISLVDQRLNEAKQRVVLAERVLARSMESQNGDDFAKALQHRDEAQSEIQQLSQYKQNATQRQVQAPSQQQPRVDPVAVSYYKQFVEEHPWFDQNGGNEESAIALAIDTSLVKEGYQPNTEEYWDELHDRLERRIPEKFQKTAPKREARGGPAMPTSKNNSSTGGKVEFHLSAARKQALIDSGIWDDPAARKKSIEYYRNYDREKAGRG
jgi:hypothetical protein